MLPAERDFYSTQSVHSDPGATDRLAELPGGPDELALLVRHLLIHRDETGRFGCALSEARYRAEAETRYIDDILDTITRLDGAPLSAPRRPLDRFAGTCRDFALLHCSLLRHTGTPARIRCGYATYFAPGFHDDHWMTEYWHPERGWILSDPQMVPDSQVEKAYELDFDPLDVPRDRFLVAGEGWRRCRAGEADPKTFGVSALGLMGRWMVRANVVRDLAALNRAEVLPWDAWGLGDSEPGIDEPGEAELALLDEAAEATVEADFDRVRALYLNTPGLRVPETITSYQSYDGECEVRLRGGPQVQSP
ncbi:MAG: transglutaminase-like domain-containing protein [Streptomyces sp.]|uniref:transglutaminase-like domain-containing protein n=1 Tax=Streptomyces sp. TaxID=1931 RepID=UPI003D6AAF42